MLVLALCLVIIIIIQPKLYRFEGLRAPPHAPRGQPISQVGGGTPPCSVGTSSPSHIDVVVLDFSISLALWNDIAENIDFGSANRRKLFFSPLSFLGDTYEHPYRT